MTLKAEILARFSGEADGRPFFLPDLTLWYDWHQSRDSLPDQWGDYSLSQVARVLRTPVWWAVRPWQVETPGVEIVRSEEAGNRVIRTETSAGTLVAQWKLMGTNGDWWQTE